MILQRVKEFAAIILIFLIQAGETGARERTIDSLKSILEKATPIEKISIMNDLSRAYWSVSTDKSTEYAKEALEMARLHNDKAGIAESFNRLGNAEYLKTNYTEALDYYSRSIEIRLEIGDKQGMLGSYNNLYLVHNIMGNHDAATGNIEKAVTLSIEIDDKPEIAYYSNILGSHKSESHDFESALENIERALGIYRELGDHKGAADALSNLGRMFQRMNLFDTAMEYFFEALAIYTQSGDISGIASVNNNIGITHKNLNNLDLALEYYSKSLELYMEMGTTTRGIPSLLNNIGIIWHEKGDYETAIDFFSQAMERYENLNDIKGVATASHNTGLLQARLGNYTSALQSYMRSAEINIQVGNIFSLANNYNNLGELFLLQKEYDKAIKYLDEALEMAERINAKQIISENFQFRSDLYRETAQFDKALNAFEAFYRYKDSIFKIDTGTKIAELQFRNQRADQINELELLQIDNQIQMLRLQKQKRIIIYLGLVALVVALFGFIILTMYRFRKSLSLTLKEKTQQLEVANKKLIFSESNLKNMNKAKDKFFSIIAHDLKNPFNALLGFSETLNQNYKELSREQTLTYIEIIDKSAKNLYRLLENLLDWSKSQTGNMQFNPEKLEIREVTDLEIAGMASYAARKEISIDSDISPHLIAYADKNITSTIIRNLINNAIKFTHNKGSIIISAKENHGFIEISVTDTGIGIDETEKMKLFNPDYNITSVGTNDEKGTGLGLLLCKEFVEKSGGTIRVESKKEKGSTFTFSLPL